MASPLISQEWKHTKSSMRDTALRLMGDLGSILKATTDAAPSRTKPFFEPDKNREDLSRGSRARIEERFLEKALWNQYLDTPVGNLWSGLLGCQIPLFAERKKRGWGHIDLLAYSSDNSPIIVELKREDSQDTPLRMLIEAAAYACAIRSVWPQLRDELIRTEVP